MSQYGEFLKLDGSGFGFTTDFNGTSYMIVHDYKWGDSYGDSGYDTSDKQLYTELLSFKLNLVNYTTLSYGADSPYTCYIDGNTVPYADTPCKYDTTGVTANTYNPLLGVPSAFSYAESQGSPQKFFTLSNLISSLSPSGGGGGSGASTQSTITATCVDGTTHVSTGSPCAEGDSAVCKSLTTPYCSSSGTPTCSSGSLNPECSAIGSSPYPYCSNGETPMCSGSSTPTCDSNGNVQLCPEDNKPPTCPATSDGTTGVIMCSPSQTAPTCTISSANPSCDTTTDPSNSPQCKTELQPQCVSGNPTHCSSPGSTPQCQITSVIPPAIGTSSTPAIFNTYVNSVITGYLLVPYHYTYQLTQTWSPDPVTNGEAIQASSYNIGRSPSTVYGALPESDYTGTLCPDYPLPSPAPAPDPNTHIATSTTPATTVYTMSQVNLKSNNLQENIQGGSTYLQQLLSNQGYYTSNLSDAGAIISPDLNYNIYSNRWFGEMFVNLTVSPTDSFPVVLPDAQVINAESSSNYQLESYMQQSSLGRYFAYAAQDAITLSSPKYGVDCGGTGCPANYYYDPSSAASLATTISYANAIQNNILPLFQLYEQSTYVYNLDVDLSENQNIYGYNRLVYTFADDFNNIITAPLDADIANLASVTATAQTSTNPLNENETNVIVTGTATYSLPSGTQPLPAGSQIYLYYGTDVNFYNATSSPITTPDDYYKYAMQCAFSTTSASCQFANPLSTLTQPAGTNPQTFGPTEANTINFNTQYDYNSLEYQSGGQLSGTTPPQCAPPPKSMLLLPNYNECNIYGNFGLSARRDTSALFNNPEYCIPVYDNGNGMFTSQLGLIGIANTLPDGTFNAFFTTCGSGSGSIIAQYYGYPPPEPVPFTQPSLQYSANTIPSKLPASAFATSNEFNYAYSQASQSIPINIGSYALSLGGIDAVALVIAAFALLAVTHAKREAKDAEKEPRKTSE